MDQPSASLSSVEPPERKRGWGRISFAQVLVIVLMAGIGWATVAVIGSVAVFGGIADAAPVFVNQVVGQLLGDQIDDYMVRMYYRDPGAAAALFLNPSVTKLTRDLQENYVLYDGYLETRVQDVEGLPEGWMDESNNAGLEDTEATVTGDILYEGDFTGTFEARLLNSGGSWYLLDIHIEVPPEKIDAYERAHP